MAVIRIAEATEGGVTIRCRSGPRGGLRVCFFIAGEVNALVAGRFTELIASRLHTTHGGLPSRDHWSHWERSGNANRGQ
jgi:hypothetical protein